MKLIYALSILVMAAIPAYAESDSQAALDTALITNEISIAAGTPTCIYVSDKDEAKINAILNARMDEYWANPIDSAENKRIIQEALPPELRDK